jgi:hypothetical protein
MYIVSLNKVCLKALVTCYVLEREVNLRCLIASNGTEESLKDIVRFC